MTPRFSYVRPTSVAEAVRLLANSGEEAQVLAGGQSLLPMIRLRLASPKQVIDVSRLPELLGVKETNTSLVIGAMTTHHDVLQDSLIRRYATLLVKATETIGDPAVRHRGTLGGAIAHADPAGDLPSVVLALGGELVVEGPRGRRTIAADQFFRDCLRTALAPDELLIEIRLRKRGAGWGFHYEKFRVTANGSTVVGAAVGVCLADGVISEAVVGLTNMGPTPLRAVATEVVLTGAEASVEVATRAARAAAVGTSPASDVNASVEYRKHLARLLTRRAVIASTGPLFAPLRGDHST